jgi:hypothetical protein
LIFRTEFVLHILLFRTEITLTVLLFRTEIVLTVLIFRTGIAGEVNLPDEDDTSPLHCTAATVFSGTPSSFTTGLYKCCVDTDYSSRIAISIAFADTVALAFVWGVSALLVLPHMKKRALQYLFNSKVDDTAKEAEQHQPPVEVEVDVDVTIELPVKKRLSIEDGGIEGIRI